MDISKVLNQKSKMRNGYSYKTFAVLVLLTIFLISGCETEPNQSTPFSTATIVADKNELMPKPTLIPISLTPTTTSPSTPLPTITKISTEVATPPSSTPTIIETPTPTEVVEEPEPAETPTPEPQQWGLDWNDLESLTFRSPDGRLVQLVNGKATIEEAQGPTTYTLQNRISEGDLNGDGEYDLVAHITASSETRLSHHLLLGVIDNGYGGQALLPVQLGHLPIIENIETNNNRILVSVFSREPDEPSNHIITQQETLEIVYNLETSIPSLLSTSTIPLETMPTPAGEAPDIPITFKDNSIGTIISDHIDYGSHRTYTLPLAAQEPFSVSIDAPIGIWLEARVGEHIVRSASERLQTIKTEMPENGVLNVTVVSTHATNAAYKITFEADSTAHPSTIPSPIKTPEPTESDNPIAEIDLTSTPVLYLTFDDGPHPIYTNQILDILKKYEVQATFFVVGSIAERYPETLQRIYDEGHTIGNHTWNHENLTGLPKEDFDETIIRTQELLGDRGAKCLRPPYGLTDSFTEQWLSELGLELVLWTVDPEDWKRPTAYSIAKHLVEHAENGANILLHDGGYERSQTVIGLDAALSELTTLNYDFRPSC